jgi:PAS domain S-box-containing protein
MKSYPISWRCTIWSVVLPLIAATALEWVLWPVIKRTPWVLFYPAVYVASWFGGWRAGLAMVALSIGTAYMMFMSHGVLTGQWVIPVVIFVVMGTLFSLGHERMRRAEHHLRQLFEQSSDAIFVADLNGNYTDVNQAACDLLGYTRGELLGMCVTDVVLPADGDRLKLSRERQLAGVAEFSEWTLLRKDGTTVPTEISAKILPGGLWQASVRDISQSRAAKQKLQRAQAALLEAQRLGRIGSWEWDVPSDRLEWSPELFQIYGLDPNLPPPTRTDLDRFYPADSLQARQAALDQALQSGQPYSAEREIVRDDGSRRWVYSTVECIRDDHGAVVKLHGTAQDVTERKAVEMELLQSRRQLREIASHREIELERERKHIAREIHDELGQLLTGLKMDLALLDMRGAVSSAAQPTLADMRLLVERTFEVARSVSSSLRPGVLDLGLVPALEWLVENFSLRWNIACQLQIEGDEQILDDVRSTAIFRVVQESLTNVSRHAQATHVDIRLHYAPRLISVTVHDNGRGFSTQTGSRNGGFGLLGMRERMLALHGRFQIESGSTGTTVAIEVPAAPEASAHPVTTRS